MSNNVIYVLLAKARLAAFFLTEMVFFLGLELILLRAECFASRIERKTHNRMLTLLKFRKFIRVCLASLEGKASKVLFSLYSFLRALASPMFSTA